MTFLDESELWPRDISGDHTFILKAIQEIGRRFGRADTRLPSMVYRYDFDLPEFGLASEDDKIVAADIINHNLIDDGVEISENNFYLDSSETFVVIRNAHITKVQWDRAIDLIRKSRDISIENIDNILVITSVIFQGVASAKIVAVERIHNRPEFILLPAETLNISNDDVIRARLALGQIRRNKPFDLNPHGNSYIYLEAKSLDRWINSVGRQYIRVGIAKRKLIRLAQNHHNHLPSELNKERILDEDLTGFNLDDKEKDMLWASLPDKPFKMPGLRQGASRKGEH